ncbi:MAG: hypothetical protein K0S33_453 [Bacteroidetes bacterium]|jgi:hypothetical protein|nr:hypothetical protein [Bacteroidota bacterium]
MPVDHSPRLFMLLLGCRPAGRLTEQHDIFLGVASSLKELVPAIKASWKEAKGNIHIDAWRQVTQVGSYRICVEERTETADPAANKLFFINLGGYKQGEFDEFHYKVLIVAPDKADAIKQAKQTAFYKHVGFSEAPSHIDDKYGVDVDEIHEMKEILLPLYKDKFQLRIVQEEGKEDELHLGYFRLDRLEE